MQLLRQGPREARDSELPWPRDTGFRKHDGVRDPARIASLLDQLHELWLLYPDLRLGQLLEVLRPPGKQSFYVEDDVWLKRIEEYIKYARWLR